MISFVLTATPFDVELWDVYCNPEDSWNVAVLCPSCGDLWLRIATKDCNRWTASFATCEKCGNGSIVFQFYDDHQRDFYVLHPDSNFPTQILKRELRLWQPLQQQLLSLLPSSLLNQSSSLEQKPSSSEDQAAAR